MREHHHLLFLIFPRQFGVLGLLLKIDFRPPFAKYFRDAPILQMRILLLHNRSVAFACDEIASDKRYLRLEIGVNVGVDN